MSNKEKSRDGSYASLNAFHRAMPIVMIALAVFITVCFFTDKTGQFGIAIAGALRGLFSIGAYFIPAFLALHAFFYTSDIHRKKVISRIIFSLILLIFISAFAEVISFWNSELVFNGPTSFEYGKEAIGGGFIGSLIAFGIITCIGKVGFIILAVTFLAIYITYFIASDENPAKEFFRVIIYAFFSFLAKIESAIKKRRARKKEERALKEIERIANGGESAPKNKPSRRRNAVIEAESELLDDDFFEVDNGLREFRIEELGIEESRSDAEIEENPTLQNRVHHPAEVADDPVYEPVRRGGRVNTDYGIEPEGAYSTESEEPVSINNPAVCNTPDNDAPRFTSSSADDIFASGNIGFNVIENEIIATRESTMISNAISMVATAPSPVTQEEPATSTISPADIEEARRRLDREIRRERQRDEKEREASFSPASYEFVIGEEFAPVEERGVADTDAFVEGKPVNIVTEPTVSYEPPSQAEPAVSYEAPAEHEPSDIIVEPIATYNEPAPVESEPISPVEEICDNGFTLSFGDDGEDNDDSVPEITPDENESESITFEFDESDDEDGDDEDEIIPPEQRNPDIERYRSMFTVLDEDEGDAPSVAEQYAAVLDNEEELVFDAEDNEDELSDDDYEENDDEDDEESEDEQVVDNRPLFTYGDEEEEDNTPPFDYEPIPKKPEKPTTPVKEPELKPDYSEFKFPPIELLKKGRQEVDPTMDEEVSENAETLIDALAQFDVKASIKSVDRGPRITRYEIVPARGVRVSKVIGLFDDIALNLAAEGIRMEAPIPGKSAIGVEIPNKHPSTVYLRDLIESYNFTNEPSKTLACFGMDVTGNPVYGDIAKMPHMLIAGATGMGKSVCINSILISILYRARPDEVKFILIDPKTVEFTPFNDIPHLLIPVVTDPKQAAGALMWAVDEMNRRYEVMSKADVRKLETYNEMCRENPDYGEPLPQIIIVIDELNDLMLTVRKPVEKLIMSITQKARAAGIHMIIGTQRPSVDVITGVIKANIPSRVSCKVTSITDSRTILDMAGAEKLLDKGDMLFFPVGKPKPLRVQGALVSESEVVEITKFLKSNVRGAIYDTQALEEINKAAAKCRGKLDDDTDTEESGNHTSEDGAGFLRDKVFLEIVELAIKQGKISTSLIQRKFSVGYSKAAKYIDIMEDLGIVSEPNGQKPREVLLTLREWEEMLSRRDID